MTHKTMIFGVWVLSALLLGACDTSTNATPADIKPATLQTNKTDQSREVVMYKSPSCECCDGWADHLRKAGFTVKVNKRENMDAVKAEYGVPAKISSCHTALIGGYIIEGHVPAADVQRLLTEKPEIAGLTAPGMPMKAPGMQAAGLKPHGYDVLAFDKSGKTSVFHHYP